MDMIEAQRILNEYRAVVVITADTGAYGGFAAPESLLPYPKETIKTAIKTLMVALIRTRKYTDESRDHLQVGYMMLANFITDDEARIVASGEKAVQVIPTMKDKEKLLAYFQSKEWKADDKSVDIMKRIDEESCRLLDEIQKFDSDQLSNLAAGE